MSAPTDDAAADRLGRLADACAQDADAEAARSGENGETGALAADVAARAAARALLGVGLSEAAIDAALERARGERPRPAVPVPPGYVLLEELGRGGGGVVYRARQTALDREVALKVLHAGDGLFDAAIRRFEREARALARVRHPGIVAVHEVGSTGGRLWYAMDLVEGTSLADELGRGPLPAHDGAALVRSVADAVAAVHAHGLVHRDLKPGNVLLDRVGRPYVGDFGLALELGGGDDLTLTGQVVGTPAYMAPEQARGDGADVGPATDVYALGAILYEVVAGRRPFAGLAPPEQVYAAIHHDPTSLRRVRRDVPEALVRIVEKAMRKRPTDRYPTAEALVDDLDRFLAGEPVRAAPGRGRRVAGFARRRAGALGWGAAAVVTAVALVAGAPKDGRDAVVRALVAAADEAGQEGDADAAARLYARAATTSPTRLPLAVRLRAAETEVPRARRLVEGGQAAEVLARADARLASLAPDDRDAVERGPLHWVRGMALAALDRGADADVAFGAAAQAWCDARWDAARAREGLGRADFSRERTAWTAERREAAVRALGSSSLPGRRVAWREARAAIGFGNGWDEILGRVVRAANDAPPLVVTAVHEELAIRAHDDAHAGGMGWWSRVLAAEGTDAVLDALAEAAADTSRPARERGTCARLLAASGDLPTLFDVELYAGADAAQVDPMPTVALWRAVRATAPAERLRRCVDAALAGPPDDGRTARPRLAWCVARLPLEATTLDEVRAWWAAHRGDDLVPALATAIGEPADRPPNPRSILARARGTLATRAHVLLALVAPAGAAVPRLTLAGPPRDAIGRWDAVFAPDAGPYRLRIGRLAFDVARGWTLDEPDRFLDLELDRVTSLADERPLEGSTPTLVTVRLPTTARPDPGARVRFEVDAILRRGAQGLEVACTRVHDVRFGPGWSAGGGGGGPAMPIDVVLCPHRGHGGRYPDPLRNVAVLVVVEPRAAPRPPSTVATWRARIARDLGRIAARADEAPSGAWGAPRAFFDDQRALRHLASLIGEIAVPEAVDAARRLLARAGRASGFEDVARDLRRALWLAQAPDAPPIAPPAESSPRAIDTMAFLDAGAWMRARVDAPTSALAALAERHLLALPLGAEIAGDLLDAERAGRVTLSPALAARVAASDAEDRSFVGRAIALAGWTAFALVVDACALLALVRALWPRRRAGSGLAPRAWLVVLGVVAACVDVVVRGTDLLPDAAGLALAALGSALLAHTVRGRARWTSPVAFALGAAVAVAAPLLPASLVGLLGLLATSVGVAWTPRLAFALRGGDVAMPRPPPAPAADRTAVRRVALASGLALGSVLVVSSSVQFLLLPLVAVAAVLLARIWRAPAAPRRPWPIPFVLGYVLPAGALLVGGLVLVVRGVESWTISETLATLTLVVVGIATAWALLTLVTAARVRAAWQRARATGVV